MYGICTYPGFGDMGPYPGPGEGPEIALFWACNQACTWEIRLKTGVWIWAYLGLGPQI